MWVSPGEIPAKAEICASRLLVADRRPVKLPGRWDEDWGRRRGQPSDSTRVTSTPWKGQVLPGGRRGFQTKTFFRQCQ